MAKKRLTPRQQEWETEYKKLKRRVSDWKRKFHAVPDLPTKPERITKKDIERLKQFKWKNIPEAIKKVWRKEYEYRYENKMPEVYKPKQQYAPPTEQDFYNNPDYGGEYDEEWEEQHPGWDEPDEDGYSEVVNSREEIEAWIAQYIDPIDVELLGNNIMELDGSRDTIERLILEAADAYEDYNYYYQYLENNSGKIVELATRAMMGYIGYKGVLYQSFPEAMPELATVLNLGRPLTPSQSDRLQDEGWVSFDFNDL